ncbi:MAG: RDD family protein, partial [Bacteroidota bacterium]
FEAAFGKTPGKFVTKTQVVNKDGGKPTPGQLIGRTFARFIPFDAFSFLASNPVGWHDSLSKTRVVKDDSLVHLD